jgi:RNA recognition motif-containing protein
MSNTHKSRVFIQRVPEKWNNEDIYKLFSTFGSVISTQITQDRSAIIEFNKQDDAHKAVAGMNGILINGKVLRVKIDTDISAQSVEPYFSFQDISENQKTLISNVLNEYNMRMKKYQDMKEHPEKKNKVERESKKYSDNGHLLGPRLSSSEQRHIPVKLIKSHTAPVASMTEEPTIYTKQKPQTKVPPPFLQKLKKRSTILKQSETK